MSAANAPVDRRLEQREEGLSVTWKGTGNRGRQRHWRRLAVGHRGDRLFESRTGSGRSTTPGGTRRRPPVLLSAALAAACLLAVFLARSPALRVGEVEVRGLERLDYETVVRLAAVEPGTHFWQLDLGAVASRLRENPRVTEVAVHRDFPGRLVIAVRERSPVLLVPYQGVFLELDAAGVVIGSRPAPGGGELPLVTGLDTTGWNEGEPLPDDRIPGVGACAGCLDEHVRRLISEVHVGDDGAVTLYTETGLPVLVGLPGPDLERRLAPLRSILEDITANHLVAAHVDLRFQRPAVRVPQ